MTRGSHIRQLFSAHSQLRLLSMRGHIHTTFGRVNVIRFSYLKSLWETMGIDLAVANSQHLPLSHLILAVSKRVLGFLERLERSFSILAGAVNAGNSVGSRDVSREGSRTGVIPGGGRRRSGSL